MSVIIRMQEGEVKNLIRNTRSKCGYGSYIKTVENALEYRFMPGTNRPFLHCSASFTDWDKPNELMRIMIFANPDLLGLLRGHVDIYVDATFTPCTPSGFYQCLILVVFNHQTSSYVPVVYALMSHKVTSLYHQVFLQIKSMMMGKMKVNTYTSDFEPQSIFILKGHTRINNQYKFCDAQK